MKVLWLLLGLALTYNIYQYRQYHSLMEKHGQLNQKMLSQKKSSPLSAASAKAPAPSSAKEQRLQRPVALQQQKKTAAEEFGEQGPVDGDGEVGESEKMAQVEEEKREWQDRVQSYFIEDLSLSNEDYHAYLESIETLRENQQRIYDYFAKRDNRQQGDLHVPSFEERRAMFRARESLIMSMGQRIGNKKFKSLLEYERKMKMKMLKDKGYYISHGLF